MEPGEGESLGEACAGLLEKLFSSHVAPEDVAALIVEPVLGEGGFVVPPDDYLPALKERCEEHGIVFISDEVQAGFGRTGRMFGVEHSGVEPDLVILAKSLAAGFPLRGRGSGGGAGRASGGSLGGTSREPGGSGERDGGAGQVRGRSSSRRSREVGERIRERFSALAGRVDLIGEVRGLGSMVAVEFVKDRNTRSPPRARSERY